MRADNPDSRTYTCLVASRQVAHHHNNNIEEDHMARESYMKRIGNINPTLMNIHNNELKILYVHTKESCTEKSGNINPNLINTHTNQLKILSVHIIGLLDLSL